MPRRAPPFILVALAVASLLAWYVMYTKSVVTELRRAAELQGRMASRIYTALADTSSDGGSQLELLALVQQLRNSGVPQVLVAPDGTIADTANLPTLRDAAELRAYVDKLDRQNVPIDAPGAGSIHYGDSRLVRGLSTIPVLQSGALGLLLLMGLWGLRERGRAEREKVWAGMARESAHQLGTPLSSLSGWLELLEDQGAENPSLARAVSQMQQDLTRLDRVAHRFERIGRPPRRDDVDLGQMVDRMATYFAARVPTLARKVTVRAELPEEPLIVAADGVLLEWVLEVLVKNAIDALGGRDGTVVLSAEPIAEGGGRVRVADDGPGVPRAMRKKIFDAGFTTKERGWGIGLSLARRIVEENHGGKLLLADTDRGATFDVILKA